MALTGVSSSVKVPIALSLGLGEPALGPTDAFHCFCFCCLGPPQPAPSHGTTPLPLLFWLHLHWPDLSLEG